MLKFHEADPSRFKNITQWRHKMDIGSVDLYIQRGFDEESQSFYKELLIGFKTTGWNIYTLLIQDLSGPERERTILSQYTCYHLWEEHISGFLLGRTQQYVTVSKDGIKVLNISCEDHKTVYDDLGDLWIMHSLNKFNFLKLDPSNFITFQAEEENSGEVVIQIMHEYVHKAMFSSKEEHMTNETLFDEIYSI